MRSKQFVAIVAVGLMALCSSLRPGVIAAQSQTESQLSIVSSGESELLLELIVPHYEVETIEHAGQTYQRLSIPGMVQQSAPGMPQVPTRGTLLGFDTPEDISVEILVSDFEVLSGYRLYPTPVLNVEGDILDDPGQVSLRETLVPDAAVYADDAFYPAELVELGQTGYMRDQAVAQVQFYPVQYNPVTSEVRLYRRLVVRISWPDSGPSVTGADRLVSPDYESLLKATLLNYDVLDRPGPVELPPPSDSDSIGVTDTIPRLKIKVTRDAVYRLTPAGLAGAGFQLAGVDSRTIKIMNRGNQVPVAMFDANSNNLFDGSDYLLFYGTAPIDMYTSINVYWLEAGGAFGARMSPKSGTGGASPTSFPATLHAEEDSYYWSGKGSGGLSEDHWFWGNRITAPNSESYTLNLNNIASSNGTLRVRLKGRTYGSHRTEIYLNGSLISTQSWSGQIVKDQSGAVTTLRNGANTVSIKPTASGEQIHVNWIEIDYSDTYVAENNSLFFRAPSAGSYQFNVSSFTSNDIKVFDISNPNNVRIISNATVSAVGTTHTVTFRDSASTDTRYLATASYASPDSLEMDQASNLKSAGNRADYVIITHADFWSAASTLASHRRNSGLEVMVVKVEDVYDEFYYGIFNPQAIRNFLAHTLSWNKVPTYVLLLGGATYDYRDLLGFDKKNWVPTQTIELDSDDPYQDLNISDNWYVLVRGADVLPDMYIGRLAAQSTSQANDMVNKIIRYDQNPPGAPWNRHVLLVADEDDTNPFNTITYEATSNSLADRLPDDYTAKKIYESQIPDPGPAIIDDLTNTGSVLVNYAGHGSGATWGSSILNTGDVQALTNTRWPVVSVANCFNGLFTGEFYSMSEEFQRHPDAGAMAVWAPSSIGYPSGHRVMVEQFYDAIFKRNQYKLGAIATIAKLEAYSLNNGLDLLIETYVLFGDPAQTLGVPRNQAFSESVFLPVVLK